MMITKQYLHKFPVDKNCYKKLPDTTGVYIFWDLNHPVYVGKAINLKRRVESYFKLNLSLKTKRMINEANFFSYIKVNSELESLLLEAHLIKTYQPKYNVISRDDKSPLYIKITKDKYPKVLTSRKTDIKRSAAFFGPFPSSGNVKSVLSMLRKILPYSDHNVSKRACLYSHIGLCNPCPSEIEKIKDEKVKEEKIQEYRKNIRMLRSILSRRIKFVVNKLEDEMSSLSKQEKYEEADIIKKQLEKLSYITQPIIQKEYYLENPDLMEDIHKDELHDLSAFLKSIGFNIPKLNRIECYDVSHISGSALAASMVTFLKGEPEKKYYRHFHLRGKWKANDLASLREIAERRIKNLTSWGKPDLIIVDGGKGQTKTFYNVFSLHNINVIGLAKRYETIIYPKNEGERVVFKEKRVPKGKILNLVQRVRNEAHRFAKKYHLTIFKKELFNIASSIR